MHVISGYDADEKRTPRFGFIRAGCLDDNAPCEKLFVMLPGYVTLYDHRGSPARDFDYWGTQQLSRGRQMIQWLGALGDVRLMGATVVMV